jgi:hypothetical protein
MEQKRGKRLLLDMGNSTPNASQNLFLLLSFANGFGL